MSLDVVISELRSIYSIDQLATEPDSSRGRVTESDLRRWSALTGLSLAALYREIALYLARGFNSSQLTFECCDVIVNDIWWIMISTGQENWSEQFYQVYCAFDAGEYYHREKPDQDPVAEYTRPLISKIVADCLNPKVEPQQDQ